MKILISSYVFSPSVGGIETVSELLAPEFVEAGHEVVLITRTAREDNIARSYRIERRPSARRMLALVRWCDVYFQNNISLSYAWPLLFVRKPWVIAHHTWLGASPNHRNWKARLKGALLRHAANASISQPVATDLPVPSTVVGNPYATGIFQARPEISRDGDLVYLGRLVSDKGIDLLIDALAALRKSDLTPRLTIVGSGPAEAALRASVRAQNLEGQVDFVGTKSPCEVAKILNAHRVLVIPSRWAEPFGLVALEGIACGCVVVASRVGGLPEAIGPCGVLFKNGDLADLTRALQSVLTDPSQRIDLLREAPEHLSQFEPATIAAKYLEIFAGRKQPAEEVLCM